MVREGKMIAPGTFYRCLAAYPAQVFRYLVVSFDTDAWAALAGYLGVSVPHQGDWPEP